MADSPTARTHLERRAVRARLSILKHKTLIKRADLAKSVMDAVCGCNTAYGTGRLFRAHTDVVIGLLGVAAWAPRLSASTARGGGRPGWRSPHRA